MKHSILIIVVCMLMTIFTRALPFVIFGGKKEVPETIKYLGRVLPCAIMAVLVIYCLKGIDFFTGNHGVPEMLAVIAVVLLHVWKKNTLLSIGVGTAFYMFLIQVIFV
ncbi:MAG: branched-chain amino acid transporter permease [Lachnospiraceae bacterium]|nr:branched-chain amino acid transporter permease [Lachnospiraceae bacterium]